MATIRFAAALLALLFAAGTARAGGFATARFGGEHGHPTTDQPTAIYYNPAGLALRAGTRIFVEGLFAYRSASYERPEGAIDNVTDESVGTPPDAVSANAGKGELSDFVTSPFVGVATDFGVPNLGVGAAFYVPFGGQASWDKNEAYADDPMYPGAVDGVQRWATIDGVIRELYFSGGAAYRLPGPRVTFGLSLSLVREQIQTVRARTATGTDDLVAPDGRVIEGRSLVDVSNTTVAAGAGVIWEPMDDLWLGLSYQSQPGFGVSTQEGTLTNKFGAGPEETSEIDLEQALPDVFRLGARFRPTSQVELRLSGDYTRWSVMEDQCLLDANNPDADCVLDEQGGATDEAEGVIVNIHRDWSDTWGVRGGASYWIVPEVELAGGVSFDSNAVPDENLDPALMDMNKIISTVGVRYLVGQVLINASYSNVFYFDRTVDPRPRDDMGDAIGPPTPSAVPDGAGTYSQSINLFNVGAEIFF